MIGFALLQHQDIRLSQVYPATLRLIRCKSCKQGS